MSVQTTFGFSNAPRCIGELYDYDSASGIASQVMSKTTSAQTPFGRAVFSAAATPNVCEVVGGTADVLRVAGVTVADRSLGAGQGYSANTQAKILQYGLISVFFETAMADLQKVYVRYAESTTGAGDSGQFGGSATTGMTALAGARFRAVDGPLTASGIGVLECNFIGITA